MYEVEHILTTGNNLGESPQWTVEERALYWVDIMQGTIYRFWPAKGTYEVFNTGIPVGALSFRASGGLILATRDGFARWDSKSNKLNFIADPEADNERSRFNDGKVDRQGRFWAGTMIQGSSKAVNSLYRLDPDGTVHTMETGIVLSNGLGWSPDDKTMYFNDSGKNVIYAYDFNAESGSISNRRTFVQLPEGEIIPDGLTVDREGYVWCVLFRGYKIIRYDPEGKIAREIRMPTCFTTSCIFGGDNMDELYVTTAWRENRDKQAPFAGDLFRIQTDVKGLPEPKFAG